MRIVNYYGTGHDWCFSEPEAFHNKQDACRRLDERFKMLIGEEEHEDLTEKEKQILINAEIKTERESDNGMLTIAYDPCERFEIIDCDYSVDIFCDVKFLDIK